MLLQQKQPKHPSAYRSRQGPKRAKAAEMGVLWPAAPFDVSFPRQRQKSLSGHRRFILILPFCTLPATNVKFNFDFLKKKIFYLI
jgi:hypothetical protein